MSESSSEIRDIELTVNVAKRRGKAEPRLLLVDFLRHELGLTGTHVGCEHGVCGACTVMFNGHSARACLLFAAQANGADIVTVEGLANPDGSLNVLQEAFREHHGLQCGFCTPGMLITLTEHLRDNPDTTEEEMRVALSGNLCRCTGYEAIVEAGLDAARQLRDAGKERA